MVGGEKKEVRVLVVRELKPDGITVGALSDWLRTLVKRIHAIPSIETTPIAMGIRIVRSNEGRGCIADKVLLRFYPHSFRYRVPHPVGPKRQWHGDDFYSALMSVLIFQSK